MTEKKIKESFKSGRSAERPESPSHIAADKREQNFAQPPVRLSRQRFCKSKRSSWASEQCAQAGTSITLCHCWDCHSRFMGRRDNTIAQCRGTRDGHHDGKSEVEKLANSMFEHMAADTCHQLREEIRCRACESLDVHEYETELLVMSVERARKYAEPLAAEPWGHLVACLGRHEKNAQPKQIEARTSPWHAANTARSRTSRCRCVWESAKECKVKAHTGCARVATSTYGGKPNTVVEAKGRTRCSGVVQSISDARSRKSPDQMKKSKPLSATCE